MALSASCDASLLRSIQFMARRHSRTFIGCAEISDQDCFSVIECLHLSLPLSCMCAWGLELNHRLCVKILA